MNTVRLHRVLRANPEKVYRAFLEADAIAKWLPPYGFTCRVEVARREALPQRILSSPADATAWL